MPALLAALDAARQAYEAKVQDLARETARLGKLIDVLALHGHHADDTSSRCVACSICRALREVTGGRGDLTAEPDEFGDRWCCDECKRLAEAAADERLAGYKVSVSNRPRVATPEWPPPGTERVDMHVGGRQIGTQVPDGDGGWTFKPIEAEGNDDRRM